MDVPITISLCVIAKDEADNLARCLNSAKRCVDQMVVVDTGSSDGTKALAQELGAETYDFAWRDDFSAARNFSLDQARCRWILVLDADEALTPGSARRLRQVVADAEAKGFATVAIELRDIAPNGQPCTSYSQNKLWRRSPDVRYHGKIHEIASVRLPALDHGLQVDHRGYIGIPEELKKRKGERNLKLLRQALAAAPDDPKLLKYLAKELAVGGDHAGSNSILEPVLAACPADQLPGLLFLRALNCAGMKDHQAAARLAAEAAKQFPDRFEFHYLLGICSRELGDHPVALAALREYLRLREALLRGELQRDDRETPTLNDAGKARLALADMLLKDGAPGRALPELAEAYLLGAREDAVKLLAANCGRFPKAELLDVLRRLLAARLTPPLAAFAAAVCQELGPEDADFLKFVHGVLKGEAQ